MNSNKLTPVYRSFLLTLNDKKIEYLLVGGYAVRYYGYRRATRDLDIWTGTAHDNPRKLVEVFKLYGVDDAQLTTEVFRHNNRIVRMEFPPVKIHILNPIIGQKAEILGRAQGSRTDQVEILTVQTRVNFIECFAERCVDDIDGVEVNIISLRHLIAIKMAGDRSKDRDDLFYLS